MNLKVLIVDDEPGALRFLSHMIASRCSGWEVISTAENGRQALECINKRCPDMVLTDIRMPIMDGIGLAEQIKGNWPDVHIALVSGYEDFMAAKNAIKYGVSEYLMKPVQPSQLVETMNNARRIILSEKNCKASKLLTAAVLNQEMDVSDMESCFSTDRFKAAAVRFGTLPSRYDRRISGAYQSSFQKQENSNKKNWLIPGRDENEFFIFYEECSSLDDIKSQVQLAFKQENTTTCTAVICLDIFPITQAGAVVKAVIHTLDRTITLGARKITTSVTRITPPETKLAVDFEFEQRVESMCTCCCRTMELRELLAELFSMWDNEQRPIYYILRDTERLLSAIERGITIRRHRIGDVDLQIEEAMLLSSSIPHFHDRLWNLILLLLSRADQQDAPPGSEAFFTAVKDYIEQHLSESISLQTICDVMGISQTYMSRIFRKHTTFSFSEYLTRQRIARAKHLLQEEPGMPLHTVAELCGYKDQFYFSKVFRGREGIPPSQYVLQMGR